MAKLQLRLRKHEPQNVSFQWLGAWRLRVEADDQNHTGADPNVFMHLRHPLDPYTNIEFDEYQGVASPVDMSEFPVGAPDSKTTFPYFRLSYFEIDLRSIDLVGKVWTDTIGLVKQLLEGLVALEDLKLTESVWVDSGPVVDYDAGADSESSSLSDTI